MIDCVASELIPVEMDEMSSYLCIAFSQIGSAVVLQVLS